MATAVFLNTFIKIDLKNLQFEYNNGETPIIIIMAVISVAVIFLTFDFWYEKIKSNERRSKDIIMVLKDESTSDLLKIELLKFLRNNK